MLFSSFIVTSNEVGTREGARKGLREKAEMHYISTAKIQQSRVRGWQQGHCWVEGRRWTDAVSCPGESEHGEPSLTTPHFPPPCTIAPPN